MSTATFHEDWFCQESRDAVARLVDFVDGIDGDIIEIGAWEGRSTIAIANAAYPRVVHSCDTWEGSGHEISEKLAAERDVYATWRTNVDAATKGNVVEHRMGWREFVPTVDGPVALCFIDAAHSYREVFDNVAAIIPKMAPGGIICGDDAHHGPVKDAIFDLLGTANILCDATLWVWQVPTNRHEFDAVKLRAIDMRLAPTRHEGLVDLDRVQRIWRAYVENVSEHDMAASFGTIAYLYRLCDVVQPKRILDLGSGISSALFRKWATERGANCDVVSVDDNQEWLDRTAGFLVENELPFTGLNLWPVDIPAQSFDLVFHDFAGGELREQVAEIAAAAVRPGGAIVFDDAHHDGHMAVFRRVAEANDIELYSLAGWTMDAISRFAVIGLRAPDPLDVKFAELCATPSDINEHLPMLSTVAESAQHIVELGARSGVSTLAWLHGLRKSGGRLTSIDLSPAPEIGTYANWEHIQGDDTDADIMAQVDECDVLFIDTSHHFEHTLWELRNWSPKVRRGGVILCHDTELERPWDPPCPETDPDFPVKSAIEKFVADTGWRWINMPNCWGLGIIEVGER